MRRNMACRSPPTTARIVPRSAPACLMKIEERLLQPRSCEAPRAVKRKGAESASLRPSSERASSVRLAAEEGRNVEHILLVARRSEALGGIERAEPGLRQVRGRLRLGRG